MTYILYGLCIVLTLVSFLKDKEKTKKAKRKIRDRYKAGRKIGFVYR